LIESAIRLHHLFDEPVPTIIKKLSGEFKMAVIGNVKDVHANVISRLEKVSKSTGKDVNIISGKRNGSISDSAHNTGIAVDIMVDGLMSIAIVDELVDAGFSGVGEYYRDADGNDEANTGHGDIRGLPGSEKSGEYAAGGKKSSKVCWHRLVKEYAKGRKSGHKCPS
jgi:hypothetical protein